jgi:RepB DNA-primase from phage plasmid
MLSRWFQVSFTEAKIDVAVNPLRSGSRKRTKEFIFAVRHLYLEFDIDGEARLTSIRASDALSTPIAFISTSPGKYQVTWRIDSATFALQEGTLKLVSIPFGRDPVCTDLNQIPSCVVSRIASTTRRIRSQSNTLAIPLGIPMTSGWISWRRMPSLRPVQSHRESIPITTPIPNAIGRGFSMNLPMARTPRRSRASSLRAAPINPIRSTTRSEPLMSHRPDFGSSKVCRWTKLSRCMKFAVASSFQPHSAPFVRGKLRQIAQRMIARRKIA